MCWRVYPRQRADLTRRCSTKWTGVVHVLISRAHGWHPLSLSLSLSPPLPRGRFWRSAIFVVRDIRFSGWLIDVRDEKGGQRGLGILFRLENSRYTRSISPRRRVVERICGEPRRFFFSLLDRVREPSWRKLKVRNGDLLGDLGYISFFFSHVPFERATFANVFGYSS